MRLLGTRTPFDEATQMLIVVARAHTRALITEHLMTIGLPRGGRLRLGSDLSGEFPSSLREITNPDLRALLKRIDPTPDSLHETGAADWVTCPIGRISYLTCSAAIRRGAISSSNHSPPSR